MKRLLPLFLLMLFASIAEAHFGLILPEKAFLSQGHSAEIGLQLKFIHPFEQHYMEMARPKVFGVRARGEQRDLLDSLIESKGKSADQTSDFTFWQGAFIVQRPGDHTFYMEPQPYWEPAEDLFIIHYTKVCVGAYGLEDSWSEPLGLETEIVPLVRPYGLWTGNLFSGQVLLNGEPVPYAEVEVEYLNESPGNPAIVKAPGEPFVTQVVRADANGVFHYAMPRAGWWGFAALSEAAWTLPHEGVEKGVELGAVIWVQTRDMR